RRRAVELRSIRSGRRPGEHDVDVLPVALVVVDPLVERVEEPVLDDELAARAVQPERVRVLRGRLVARGAPEASPFGHTLLAAIVARAVDPVLDAAAVRVAGGEVVP